MARRPKTPKRHPRRRSTAEKPVRIAVSVHAPGGRHLAKAATVSLSRTGQTVTLKRPEGRTLYEGDVEPGTYTLSVTAAGMAPSKREVHVPREGKTASVYLGSRGWPAYRYGENVVPFEPHEDHLAIGFESRRPSPRQAKQYVASLTKQFPLAPLEHDSRAELPFAAAEGAIWLFRLTQPSSEQMRATITRAVNEMFGSRARVGMPVDLVRGQVKVMDRRFVVRFRDHLKPADIDALVKGVGARILRSFIQAGNARLVEFMRGTYRDHLKIVDDWVAKQLLVYGEPDLIAEFTDDAFPADPPNDPTFANQANLTLQNADNAWQYLNGISANLTLGSPTIYVATLDRGVDTDHPDIVGNLTDGAARLAQCYDFDGLQPCTVPGYAPDTSHGMGVFGIIAANTNNNNDMAGIASNVHQLGLERPTVFTTSIYPDCLLWAAGFDTNNGAAGWPAEPIAPAADVISCSHGVNNLALSGLMDDTLRYLTVYGRGGKGTVIIYSAGNDGQVITGVRVWAAHPRTLAISNSLLPDGGGVERLDTGIGTASNFGPEIDICAQGTNARSLNDVGGEQIFGGTSAAAPTVNAAAALMLSAEPNLTWVNVRDILRATAVQIDPANADPQGMWVGGFSWWYGFGRLDIDAAVQAADGFDPGAVNLVLRDSLGDTGMIVPTMGTFWHSPDLWVRQTDPTGTPLPAYNVNPPHENAQSGQDNWVQVRVKNVGTAPSGDYFVRAYLTHFAGSQFQYPADYVPSINSGDPIPNPLVQATYLIGEQQGTGLAAGAEHGFVFLWPSALVPPAQVAGVNWHPCLLAEVSPHTPPAPSGNLPFDNKNLCQRNITIDYSDDDVREMAGVIGNKDDDARIRRIKVCRMNLPKKARVWVRFLDRRVEAAATKYLKQQEAGAMPGAPPQGGVSCGCHKSHPGLKRALTDVPAHQLAVLDQLNEHRIFRIAAAGCMTLDVPMTAGPLAVVVLGCYIPKGTPKGQYEVALIEQSLDGRNLGAFALQANVK